MTVWWKPWKGFTVCEVNYTVIAKRLEKEEERYSRVYETSGPGQ